MSNPSMYDMIPAPYNLIKILSLIRDFLTLTSLHRDEEETVIFQFLLKGRDYSSFPSSSWSYLIFSLRKLLRIDSVISVILYIKKYRF